MEPLGRGARGRRHADRAAKPVPHRRRRGGLDEERARDWVVARMVNAMWTIHDGDAATPDGREWITVCVTIAKAVQD